MTNSLDRYTRGKYVGQINYTCNRPHRDVSISNDGECFLCICDAWLPVSAGNIESFSKLEDIWNNPKAKEIQQDVDNKKFTNCAVEHCGILHNNIIEKSYRINLAIDNSCNLACPTCRREMINHISGPIYEAKLKRAKHFLQLLKNFKEPLTIILIGNGDPLASTVMRPIVLDWKPAANQKIILFTNGLLMKKLLPESTIFNNISEFHISVDAGSEEIYEKVRLLGKYKVLRENLDWLANNRPKNSRVVLKFTVSAANATDIVNFSDMCNYYGFQGEVTKLDDWGTFDDFESQEVIDNKNHSLHSEAMQQLITVKNHKHIWLSHYFKKLV